MNEMTAIVAQATRPPFRILALDGGGMRGLYTATLLDTLAARFARERGVNNLDVGRGFDLITGTSTGGIIACALANGTATGEIVDFYCRYGPQIFTNPVPRKPLRTLLWAIRAWRRSANSGLALHDALKTVFGSETLAQVYERRGIALCIPAVNLATQMGRVFKTPHHAPLKQRDNNWALTEVCMATSAAPIFLPAAVCDDPDAPGSFAFVDGGLWANNPVLVGLIEALSLVSTNRPIEVISAGTCPVPTGRSVSDSCRWGLGYWQAGTAVLSTALNAQAQSVEHIVALLCPHLARPCTVIRLAQTLPSLEQAQHLGLDLASTEALRVLQTLGKHDADLIHSKMCREQDSDMALLRRIFQEMPAL